MQSEWGGGVTGRNLFSIPCRAGCAQDHRGRGDCGYYCVTPCFGLLAEALPHHSILSFWKDQPVCQRFPQIWATFFLAPPPPQQQDGVDGSDPFLDKSMQQQ